MAGVLGTARGRSRSTLSSARCGRGRDHHRAVYSVFGSKEGVIVALGIRAFEMLGAAIREQPTTSDAAGDLIDVGLSVFRRFAIGHHPCSRSVCSSLCLN